MAKINQELLERLKTKLGTTSQAVYNRIGKIVSTTHLERHIAALLLARELGISINKYSTPLERDQLRGVNGRQHATFAEPKVSENFIPKPSKLGKLKSNKKSTPENSAFVVHGRDHRLTQDVYSFIRSLGVTILEWNHAIKAASKGNANPYIGDILHKVLERAGAVVILLTPDDEVRLSDVLCRSSEKSTEGKIQGQARPNVLFEAGLALGSHPSKTILVQIGKIKDFSDVGGKHILRLNNSSPARVGLANKLESVLGKIDRTGDTWLSVGDFTPSKDTRPKKKK